MSSVMFCFKSQH